MENKLEINSEDSSKLEDLFISKIPNFYKVILSIGVSMILITEIIALLMFLIKSENKNLLSFEFDLEFKNNDLFNALLVNNLILFCFILVSTTVCFTFLIKEILFRREKFYETLGSNSVITLGISLNLLAIFHLISILRIEINTVYLMIIFLITAITSSGNFYFKMAGKTFNNFKDVITYRALVAYLVSLYFYIFCSLTVKCLQINNSNSVAYIILMNSIYGLASLYFISIEKDSFYAVCSIILELGGFIDAFSMNSDNKIQDDKIIKQINQIICCYVIIGILMLLAVIYNLFRSRSSESFGFSNNDMMEQLIASKNICNKVNADSEDEKNA
jgi:hypothetical protein